MEKIHILSNENDLIEGLKAQNPAAFDALYSKYASILYGNILQIIQNQSIAQQILEDTFINIWNNIEQYDSTNGNLIDFMKRVSHALVRQQAHTGRETSTLETQNINPTEISSNTFEKNQKNQNLQTDFLVLDAEIEANKIKHKIIIDLIYFKRYSVENIAKELHLSVESVKNIAKLALNQLKNNRFS